MTEFAIAECPFHGPYSANLDACPLCENPLLASAIAGFSLLPALEKAPKQQSKKIEADGHTFDSNGEYRRYIHLLTMQTMAFEVAHLEVHPKWELLPRVVMPKNHFRLRTAIQSAISYEADFSYFVRGIFVVEDFKAKYGNSRKNIEKGIAGKPIVTDAARLRHKLLIAKLTAKYDANFIFKIVTESDESVGG